MSRVLGGLASACLGCGASDSASDEVETGCETLWPAEDGIDYGGPWESPLMIDLPDVKLDLEPVATQLDSPAYSFEVEPVEPVDGWSVHPESGVYHRPVSEDEVERFGWVPGDVLIQMPRLIEATTTEVGEISLVVPLYDGVDTGVLPSMVQIELERRGVFGPMSVIDNDSRPSEPVEMSLFGYYAPPGLTSGTHAVREGEVLARLTSDRAGAINVRGVGLGRTFSVRGPLAHRAPSDYTFPPPLPGERLYLLTTSFDEPDTSSFSIMEPSLNLELPLTAQANVVLLGQGVEQCTDGLDNDGDGVGDECDYECHAHPDYAGPGTVASVLAYENAKSFGIFGDLRYCSQAADT